jgi:hypothetical protein
MSQGRATIFVHLYRDAKSPGDVRYVLRKSWWVGPSAVHPRGETRSKVIAEGRFQHPDAVDDVDLLIGELAENLQPHPHSQAAHGSSVPASTVRGERPLPLQWTQ